MSELALQFQKQLGDTFLISILNYLTVALLQSLAVQVPVKLHLSM